MTLMRALACVALIGALTAPLARADDPQPPEREGGLTGTGIVGTITDLGSIIVGGQRITFASDQNAASALGPLSAQALQPGDTVAVAVTPDGRDWRATEILLSHQIVGPIQTVEDGLLIVLGTQVVPPNSDHGLGSGDWVAVSGLWRGDQIVASRLTPLPAQERAHIMGSYPERAAGEPFRLGGTWLTGLEPRHARPGDIVRASGTPEGTTLRVMDLRLGLFENPVGLVLVEGYLSNTTPSGHYTVLGTGVSAFASEQDMAGQRVSLCGYQGALLPPQSGPPSAGLALSFDRLGCGH